MLYSRQSLRLCIVVGLFPGFGNLFDLFDWNLYKERPDILLIYIYSCSTSSFSSTKKKKKNGVLPTILGVRSMAAQIASQQVANLKTILLTTKLLPEASGSSINESNAKPIL